MRNNSFLISAMDINALISIAEIKNELLRISPFENIRVPVNSDLQFLYQKEWDIIKESILTLGSESWSIAWGSIFKVALMVMTQFCA